MRYEIQHNTLLDGWVNTRSTMKELPNGEWDIKPETFASENEAQAALDDYFDEIAEQIKAGTREPDEGYDREEFRVVPCCKRKGKKRKCSLE